MVEIDEKDLLFMQDEPKAATNEELAARRRPTDLDAAFSLAGNSQLSGMSPTTGNPEASMR